MPSLTAYDRGFAFIDGALQGECDSVSIEWQGDPIPVDTLARDFAGTYQIPKHAIVTYESFVPATGIEFNPVAAWKNGTVVTSKVQLGGGLAMEGDGVVMAPSFTSTPSQPSKFTFKVMIGAEEFK